MTFARLKPAGWTDGDTITPTEINGIDTNQSEAVDGTAGGTYTPAAVVAINGSGIKSDNIGASTLTGALAIQSTVTPADGTAATAARLPFRIDTAALGNFDVEIRDSANVYDIYIDTSVHTLVRTWTLVCAGAVTGELCMIKMTDSSANATDIKSKTSGAVVGSFTASPTVGDHTHRWILFRYDGTDWVYLTGHPDTSP